MTGLTLGVVRTWRADRVAAVAQALAATERRLAALGECFASGGVPSAVWGGTAAGAAARRRSWLVGEHRDLVATLRATVQALGEAAEGVAGAARLVGHAEELARRHGLALLDDGRVVDLAPLRPPMDPVDAQVEAVARERARAEVGDYAEQAVRRAELADAALAAALASTLVAAGQVAGPRDPAGGTVPAPPDPPPGRPGELPSVWDNAAWWVSLSADEQRRAVAEHPQWVGPRDGVPAWARDQANRVLLDLAEEDLLARSAALASLAAGLSQDAPLAAGVVDTAGTLAGGVVGVYVSRWLARQLAEQLTEQVVARVRAELAVKVQAVRAVRQVLAQRDGRPRQLLEIDTTGRLAKAVVSVGDVDRAGHVAVLTGGFTTTVESGVAQSDRTMSRMRDLSTSMSRAHGDGREVATVTWMGYEAPQVSGLHDPRTSVLSIQPALAGARALADFTNGLDAARPDNPAHLTLWGHSYGSTTSGVALRDHATGVDDLVAFGSPGLGVREVGQLRLPAGRVHVLEAASDLVADAGWFGADPGLLRGSHQLSADAARLPAAGAQGRASEGHSGYLDVGTTSAWNLAAVAAGTPALLVETRTCLSAVADARDPSGCGSPSRH